MTTVADLLEESKEVIVTPGYGLCVAKAQYPLAELAKELTKRGKRIRFAVHPVAGELLRFGVKHFLLFYSPSVSS